MAFQGSGVVRPVPPLQRPQFPSGTGQRQPVTMPSCRQEGKKVQGDVLYGLLLITTFIIFNKLWEQPGPVPCVLLQLASL